MEALNRALKLTMWKGAIESSWQKLTPKCTTVVLTTVLLKVERGAVRYKSSLFAKHYVYYSYLYRLKSTTTVYFFTILLYCFDNRSRMYQSS